MEELRLYFYISGFMHILEFFVHIRRLISAYNLIAKVNRADAIVIQTAVDLRHFATLKLSTDKKVTNETRIADPNLVIINVPLTLR